MRGASITAFTVALALLGGCGDPAAPQVMDSRQSKTPDGAACTSERFAFMKEFALIEARNDDPVVEAAIAAAAAAVEGDASRFAEDYCALEKRPSDAVRCFHFILKEPTPGGDIGLCVTPERKITHLFLGQ